MDRNVEKTRWATKLLTSGMIIVVAVVMTGAAIFMLGSRWLLTASYVVLISGLGMLFYTVSLKRGDTEYKATLKAIVLTMMILFAYIGAAGFLRLISLPHG